MVNPGLSSKDEIGVLIADDEPGFLDQAEIFLEKKDERFNVETTTSPNEALDILEEGNFDAVVSDYQMPEMDGLEFLETVREERNSDVPFILFTGEGDEDVARNALNLGADQYFRKDSAPKSKFMLLGRTILKEIKHKLAEEELAFERNLLRSLLEYIPDSVYFKNRENKYVKISQSKAEHLGVEVEEAIGKTDFDFYPEEQAKQMAEDDRRVMEEEPIVGKVEKITRPGGEDRWVSVTKVPRYDEEGNLIGTLGISRDITEHWVVWRRMKERMGG